MNEKVDQSVSLTLRLMIILIIVMIGVLIYGLIIFFSGLDMVGIALWLGVISLIFASIIYFVHALINDPLTLGASGVFSSIGFISLYAAILLCDWAMNSKFITMVILSIFVLIILLVAYRLRRYGERQEARVLARKKRREERR